MNARQPGSETGNGQRTAAEVKPAGRPVPPSLSRAALRAEGERKEYGRGRELLERRSVMRGLILLAILIIVFALLRGGAGRAFPPGWWRQ